MPKVVQNGSPKYSGNRPNVTLAAFAGPLGTPFYRVCIISYFGKPSKKAESGQSAVNSSKIVASTNANMGPNGHLNGVLNGGQYVPVAMLLAIYALPECVRKSQRTK